MNPIKISNGILIFPEVSGEFLKKPLRINIPATGSISTEEAEEFVKDLQEAIKVAKSL